jgi:hypothetical protein
MKKRTVTRKRIPISRWHGDRVTPTFVAISDYMEYRQRNGRRPVLQANAGSSDLVVEVSVSRQHEATLARFLGVPRVTVEPKRFIIPKGEWWYLGPFDPEVFGCSVRLDFVHARDAKISAYQINPGHRRGIRRRKAERRRPTP